MADPCRCVVNSTTLSFSGGTTFERISLEFRQYEHHTFENIAIEEEMKLEQELTLFLSWIFGIETDHLDIKSKNIRRDILIVPGLIISSTIGAASVLSKPRKFRIACIVAKEKERKDRDGKEE